MKYKVYVYVALATPLSLPAHKISYSMQIFIPGKFLIHKYEYAPIDHKNFKTDLGLSYRTHFWKSTSSLQLARIEQKVTRTIIIIHFFLVLKIKGLPPIRMLNSATEQQ